MFGEGDVGDVCGPRVPSVYEGGATLLVPLDPNASTFSPDTEDSRVNTVRLRVFEAGLVRNVPSEKDLLEAQIQLC